MDVDLSTLQTGESLASPVEFDNVFIDRVGMITGSIFGKLIVCNKEYSDTDKVNKKGEITKKADLRKYILSKSETAQNLIYKIVWERLSKEGIISNGLERLNMSSAATNHGHEFEQEAILKYIAITGNDVDFKQRFVKYDEFIGGTPDGYVGEDGIIEVKCPFNGGNHIKSLLTGKIYNQDHVYQVQGYLWMTGRKWCDFMTYDPDIIEELQLKIIRVERDEQTIEALESILEEVKQIIIDLMSNELFKQAM